MATNSLEHDLKCLSIEELEKIAATMMDKQTRDYYNEVGMLIWLLFYLFVPMKKRRTCDSRKSHPGKWWQH